jgi:DNA-binding GntR family transcriptional regulator
VRALHRLNRTSHVADPDAWQSAHDAFHFALVSGAGRPVLLQTRTRLAVLGRRYRALAGVSGDGETGPASHEVISAAATGRDASAAVAVLRAHLEDETQAVLLSTSLTKHHGRNEVLQSAVNPEPPLEP